MHPCPCCGYRTLPGRGDYDLCPVCWWEDDSAEPWEYSDPNGQTLFEAQRAFLADRRPYRRRPGKVRAPKVHEARDPDWRPYEPTVDLLARVQHTYEEQQRRWDEGSRRVAQEIAADPEGPFKDYNAQVRSLRAEAPALSHREIKDRLRALGREHRVTMPEPYLELQARLTKDPDFYRRHPFHALGWLLRHSRPGTLRRHWRELRTGSFRLVG